LRLGPATVGGGAAAQLSPPAPAPMTLAAAPQAAAPRPARPVATVSVRAAAATPAQADGSVLDAGDVDRLVKRGEDYLAQGDIAAARLVLARAAATHDPRATFSLGATYDPAVLRDLH